MSSFNNKRNKPKLYYLPEISEITSESDNKIELDVIELRNNYLLPHSIKTKIPLNIENLTSLKKYIKEGEVELKPLLRIIYIHLTMVIFFKYFLQTKILSRNV